MELITAPHGDLITVTDLEITLLTGVRAYTLQPEDTLTITPGVDIRMIDAGNNGELTFPWPHILCYGVRTRQVKKKVQKAPSTVVEPTQAPEITSLRVGA